jgi:DNA-binding MarR family transcriptional regulator
MDEKKSELYEKLSRVHWLLGRQRLRGYMERGPLADTSRGQGRVLAILKMRPEISARDLSYLLGIRPQSLNELLMKLEKNGYITRAQSEEDKRSVIVSLTDKGRDAKQDGAPGYGDILECLTADEQTTLDGYLERISAALEEKLGVGEDKPEFDWVRSAKEHIDENFEKLRQIKREGRAFDMHVFPGYRFGFGFGPVPPAPPNGPPHPPHGPSDPRHGPFPGCETPGKDAVPPADNGADSEK